MKIKIWLQNHYDEKKKWVYRIITYGNNPCIFPDSIVWTDMNWEEQKFDLYGNHHVFLCDWENKQ